MGKRKRSKKKKVTKQEKNATLRSTRGLKRRTVLTLFLTAAIAAYSATLAKPHIVVVDKERIYKNAKRIDSGIVGMAGRTIMSVSVRLRNFSPITGRIERVDLTPINVSQRPVNAQVLFVDKSSLVWLVAKDIEFHIGINIPLLGFTDKKAPQFKCVMYDNEGQVIAGLPVFNFMVKTTYIPPQ